MRRTSNLAINRTTATPVDFARADLSQPVVLRRDRANAFDADAVGVWLPAADQPVGWLYRKDNNRPAVLKKLDAGGCIEGRIERAGDKVIVVFWL